MKKQKDTYDIEALINTILVLIIGLAAVFTIIWHIVDLDNYKIYKTECYNETIMLPETANLFFIKPYYSKIYINSTTSGSWGYDYEVYEDKEVENMSSEFPLDKDNPTNNLVIIGKLRCLRNNLYIDALNEAYKQFNYTSFKKDCNEYNFKINNKDLTKKWLSENCECLDKPYGVSSCTKNIPDYCYIKDYNSAQYSIPGIKILNSSKQECLDCGQTYIFPDDCSEYKCGDYKVIKQ